MKVVVVKNEQEVANAAVDRLEALLQKKPDAVLGLPTGSTPVLAYREMVKRYQEKRIDFSRVTSFNLDEYYGLPADHPQSFTTFMDQHLFKHINVPKEQTYIPYCDAEDVSAFCTQYEQRIEAAGGIDLMLVGIGLNGHVAFNEPAQELHPNTHLVQLTAETVTANAPHFSSEAEVPKQAITMGIHTILKAKQIILIATGMHKAEIISNLLHSGLSTLLPASFLKLHPQVTIIVDQEAASLVDA